MNLFRRLPSWFGHIDCPPDLDLEKVYVLHLFDTPGYAYVLLDHFLSRFQIGMLIHTGNLSSKLSIHTYPEQISEYENHLNILSHLIKKHRIEQCYISLSPNDHLPSIQRMLPNAKIYKDHGEVKIENIHFLFAHQQNLLPRTTYGFPLYRRRCADIDLPNQFGFTDWSHCYYFELIDPHSQSIYPIKFPLK